MQKTEYVTNSFDTVDLNYHATHHLKASSKYCTINMCYCNNNKKLVENHMYLI